MLVARHLDASQPAVREWVSLGMLEKGLLLTRCGRYEDALAIYDQLIVSFADAATPELQNRLGKAAHGKAVAERMRRDASRVRQS